MVAYFVLYELNTIYKQQEKFFWQSLVWLNIVTKQIKPKQTTKMKAILAGIDNI